MGHEVSLSFAIAAASQTETRMIAVGELVIAGWTGRDQAAMERHIRELEALGVARPAATPTFYRLAASRLTTRETIEVSGENSSGEVEAVLVQSGGELLVGVGSDHTDREVETYGVTVSKQMCDKPVSPTLWRYADVAEHWDELVLRAHAIDGGERRLYQEGKVAAMRAPDDLIARYTGGGGTLADDTVMFCGTLPAIGGVAPAERFEIELEDPIRGRSLRHAYSVLRLPIAG